MVVIYIVLIGVSITTVSTLMACSLSSRLSRIEERRYSHELPVVYAENGVSDAPAMVNHPA